MALVVRKQEGNDFVKNFKLLKQTFYVSRCQTNQFIMHLKVIDLSGLIKHGKNGRQHLRGSSRLKDIALKF